MSDVKSGVLTDYCYSKMQALYLHHDHEVGSEFKGNRRKRAITNCIIYIFNILNHGYNKLGRNDVLESLKKMFPRQDGMELAKYLVRQGWKAHYWNPDVFKPRDGQSEHVVSFKTAVDSGLYYGVTLSGLIVGYNKQDKFKIEHRGWFWPFGEDVKVSTEDPENVAIFQDLKTVKFAIGINRGGTHCFALSNGSVIEVHWADEGAKLYGKTDFYGYEWNSGVLLTPPDSSFASRSIAAVRKKMS
jgi:hypothetical protein